MISVAVVGQKGGVGKTTVSLNLAYAMARRGLNVLIVDADPQGAIGLSMSHRVAEQRGLYEWSGSGEDVSAFVMPTKLKELSLLPVGQPPRSRVHEWLNAMHSGEVTKRLFEQLSSTFDLVVVDAPAGLGGVSRGVLMAADYALIPAQAQPLSLRTLPHVLETLAAVREEGATIRLAGVLLTMTDVRNSTVEAVALEVAKMVPDGILFETRIPRDDVFVEASAAGVPVGLLKRRPPPVASAFDHLAAELELRVDLVEDDDGGPIALVD